MTDIRLPNISPGADMQTQMAQMRSYMYQMVEQLNWALNALDSSAPATDGGASAREQQLPGQTAAAGGEEKTEDDTNQRMANLRDLIIKSAEAAQRELDNVKKDYKSISSVTEEYYRSTSATELSGGSWSGEYPGWQEGTYIWTRSVIRYTDGSKPVETTPICVTGSKGAAGSPGTPGEKGEPGKDGVSPTVTITKSGDTTTITITDKNGTHTQTVKDGINGTPGTPGADGRTPYLHLKYSDDGGATFTADAGETPGAYIGTYSDFVEEDSTSVSDYTWVKIKGEQGAPGEKGDPGKDGVSPTVTVTKSEGTTTITITDKNGTHTQTVKDGINGTPGTPGTDGRTPYLHLKYSDDGGATFTADAGETPGAYIGTYSDFVEEDSTSVSDYTWAKIKGEQGAQGSPGKDGSPGADGAKGDTGVGISYVDVEYRLSDSGLELTGDGDDYLWRTSAPDVPEGRYLWSRNKITYTDGTVAYTAAYCISNTIDDIVDPKINGVMSYADKKVEELKGYYVAVSDFGSYLEEISQRIEADPSQLSQYFKFASDIRADVDRVGVDFASYKTDVEGYIRQGIVGYDGTVPIIGIAIGQDIRTSQTGVETEQGVYDVIDKSSNMSVWTTEKLSFYIGGQEAAYFSNGKLTVAQIAADRITGAGKWDVSFTGGVKFKWIGG